jgi:hypothetical protein
MQFSSASCHVISLGPKYFSQRPVQKVVNLLSSRNVRDQVSNPYKTSKVKALYILDSRRKDKIP